MTYDGPKISREEARAQGLKRFFTGVPCKQGHISERIVSSGSCMECNRERARIKPQDKIEGGKYAPKHDPSVVVYGPFISRELAKEKGYKQFYDEIPCMHGHYAKKAVINKSCFTCTELKRTPSPLLKLIYKECGIEFMHKRKIHSFVAKSAISKTGGIIPQIKTQLGSTGKKKN